MANYNFIKNVVYGFVERSSYSNTINNNGNNDNKSAVSTKHRD